LLLIGDGSELRASRRSSPVLQLNQDVILLGRRSDVSAWLQSRDVFVSASSLEGLPVSILEAMAAGLPVVATEVGDVPRIVQPEMGSLVPAHQPDQLANAICTLLDDPQRQRNFGAAAQAFVAKKFDLATWFERIMALYGTVMKPSGKEPRAGQVGL
jgi:glycosyltransferase involved in cell wall biosynthesis